MGIDEREIEEILSDAESQKDLIKHKNNNLLPATLLAALIGLLLGSIPVVAGVLIASRIFYPLFVAAPLLMFLFNSLLGGERGSRTLIITIVFSLISAYLGAVACQVADYVVKDSISIFRIPLIIAMVFGRSGVLPASASEYVYPLVFTALGVVIAMELNRSKSAEQCTDYSVQCTDEDEGEAEAEGNSE